MGRSRDRLVRLIGAFKLFKASVLIALGLGGLLTMPRHLATIAQHGIAWLGLFPGHEQVHHAVVKLRHLDQATAEKFGAAALAYAAVFLVEGVGLLLGKRWAEWMTVGVTASFIPIEIYEMVSHFSVGKVGALGLNAAILVYLVYRRLEDRRRIASRLVRAVGAA